MFYILFSFYSIIIYNKFYVAVIGHHMARQTARQVPIESVFGELSDVPYHWQTVHTINTRGSSWGGGGGGGLKIRKR